MKYYLPTTTLNFSNILASEAISPALRYGRRMLGFNHLEISSPNPSQDYLFVYDCVPDWTTEHSSNDDYPLILELDDSALPASARQIELAGPVRIWPVSATIYLSPQTVRFLFRSTDEMQRMLLKVTGTLENKCESLYREADCFVLVPPNSTKPFSRAIHESLVKWAASNPYDHSEGITSEVACDRNCGAELGASVGIWFLACSQSQTSSTKSKQTRLQAALSRFGIHETFHSVLEQLGISVSGLVTLIADEQPLPYRPHSRRLKCVLSYIETDDRRARAYALLDDVLDFIIARGNVTWRWDGSSIVDFCRAVWLEVLNPRLCKEMHFETYRDSFNKLLRNLQQMEAYRICDEKSPFLQAFAAFVIGGRDAGKLARLLASERVFCPEIALSLYGAVVGYSRFPRILMELDSYGPTPRPTEPQKTPDDNVVKDFVGLLKSKKVSKPYQDAVLSGKVPVHKIEEWCKKKPFPKKGVMAFIDSILNRTPEPKTTKAEQFGTGDQMPLPLDMSVIEEKKNRLHRLFIEDDACAEDLSRKERDNEHLTSAKRRAVAISVIAFQKDYKPGGYYNSDPKSYQRDNVNTIDHFIRCLSSTRTPKLNVPLTDTECAAVMMWLRTRYGC